MKNYSQLHQVNKLAHSVIPLTLVDFLKTYQTIQQKNIENSESNSLLKLDCTCPNCILTYSFLRVLNSLSNQSLLSFSHVKERKERKISQNETHFLWEIYYNIIPINEESNSNSTGPELVQFCIKISAVVGNTESDNCKNRKRVERDDSIYIEPLRKRTKVSHDDENDEDEDDDDSILEEGSDDNDNEELDINYPSESGAEEWQFENEKNHVNFVQFSIYLASNTTTNQGDSNIISPTLR